MMNPISYFTDLYCSSCGTIFNSREIQTICPKCNSPLLANYDLESAKQQLDRDQLSQRSIGMWRWFELLPIRDRKNIVSLGEGDSPLLKLTTLSEKFSTTNLFIKEEGQNPTGSFKARGLAASVSKAKELGLTKIVIPTAGNAGGALAAYAARAGIDALIYMPKITPTVNVFECKVMGARVELVDGLISDAGLLAQKTAQNEGWFNMSTFKEPYRVEGKKIMGYEIAEQLNWKLPDVIIYPTGGGTGLVGMWKAFHELLTLGWLETNKLPRMISVQAEGCAPVVKAFQDGKSTCDFWENAHTIASGLCVPLSFADRLILDILRESHGYAVGVSDEAILESRSVLAKYEGIFACPEGAATLAGLNKLLKAGIILPHETIVLFNTGSGLKYIQ